MKTAFFLDLKGTDPIYSPGKDYVIDWARYRQDKGSEFYLKNNDLITQLDDNQLIETLKVAGYNMFLSYDDPTILGHITTQMHEDDLHVFSVATDSGYSKLHPYHVLDLTVAYLSAARDKKDVRRTRISQGHKKMNILLRLLEKKADGLKIKVDTDTCWIELLR